MATREENLKKINDELEKLSDEELDKVAGGHVFDIWSFKTNASANENQSAEASNPYCPYIP